MATFGEDQDALLALVGFLAAAGEEEGHMGVLLGLGDAQLGLAMLGQVLAEDVGQRLRRKAQGAGMLAAYWVSMTKPASCGARSRGTH